jgi:hypothetical protein
MSHRGHPPVLNETKKAEILAVLSTGCSRQKAAHYVGCDPKTIYNTALRDPQFATDLMHHEAAPEIQNLINIRNAGKDPRYWRASAWFLERTNREQYGVRDLDTVTPDELSRFISCLMEMLVEEVPVARYRKRILARLNDILSDTSEVLEDRYRRGKYSYEKKRKNPVNSEDSSLPIPENRRISHVRPEGSIPDELEGG